MIKRVEFNEEVKITSRSPKANLHRNSNRKIIDDLFNKKERFIRKNPKLAYKFDKKARSIWRRIINEANQM